MYVIIVYDINVKRIDAVRNLLKRYLQHTQNSVFEGEISPGLLEIISSEIRQLIEDKDSVIIYKLPKRPETSLVGTDRSKSKFVI